MPTLISESWQVRSAPLSFPRNEKNFRRVRLLGWSAAISVSLYMHWTARFGMNPDGMSYLDVADTYLHHPFIQAINGYWSPLYSWLLAAGLWVLKPSASWEFAAVQVVNFLIFLGTLFCFEFFWFGIWRQQVAENSESRDSASLGFPALALASSGY